MEYFPPRSSQLWRENIHSYNRVLWNLTTVNLETFKKKKKEGEILNPRATTPGLCWKWYRKRLKIEKKLNNRMTEIVNIILLSV